MSTTRQSATLRRVSAQRIAAEQARTARHRRLMLLFGAVAAGVVLAIVLIALNLPDDGDDLPRVFAVTEAHPGIAAEGRALGDPNAPVTVVEYGDYQCPGCGQFAKQLEPRLVEEYVATGLVRFEFRDYAFLDERADGTESHDAAAAAQAALNQGAFWEYHATLYGNQHGENAGAFSEDRLFEAAELLGLDLARFRADYDAAATRDAVEGMTAEAQSLGLTGTPSFIVNGTAVDYTGYDAIAAAIDTELDTLGVAR